MSSGRGEEVHLPGSEAQAEGSSRAPQGAPTALASCKQRVGREARDAGLRPNPEDRWGWRVIGSLCWQRHGLVGF